MTTTVPARTGAFALLQCGQEIKIINPSGHQVVDTWAFRIDGTPAWMSMAQSRQKLGKLRPAVGDTFVDTTRQPMLTIVEDTSSGVHDMLYPPCDSHRYAEACQPEHDSCGTNLRRAIDDADRIGILAAKDKSGSVLELRQAMTKWSWTPEPLNLFMNVPVDVAGGLSVLRPENEGECFVVLRAEVDCLVVMSACPNDLLDTNGGKPGPATYEVMD